MPSQPGAAESSRNHRSGPAGGRRLGSLGRPTQRRPVSSNALLGARPCPKPPPAVRPASPSRNYPHPGPPGRAKLAGKPAAGSRAAPSRCKQDPSEPWVPPSPPPKPQAPRTPQGTKSRDSVRHGFSESEVRVAGLQDAPCTFPTEDDKRPLGVSRFETEAASESEAVDRSSEERSAGDGTLGELCEESVEKKGGPRPNAQHQRRRAAPSAACCC